jgi:VWFA-related protein
MRSMLKGLVGAALVIWLQPSLLCIAQSGTSQTDQKSDQTPGQKVTIGTNEVVLDVVVRDKKGKPVKDLGGPDFEVFEDGVKQQIQSFQIYQREAGEAPPGKEGGQTAPPGSGAFNPFAGIGVVALVFDRLSPNAREMAHKAALSYVSGSVGKDDLAGVFLIDLSLKVLQPFTNNSELLSKAVDTAASLSTSTFPSNAEQTARMIEKEAYLENEMGASSSLGPAQGGSGGRAPTGAGSGPSSAGAAQFVELKTLQMTLSIMTMFESLERDQQGYATTNCLLAVINSLKAVEGRKAIIFFSEGLAIPPAIAPRFQAVISEANRANVSIYPVDASGLRVDSTLMATAEQQKAVATTRRISQESGAEDTSGKPMTRDLERNEDVLRLDPRSGMGQLADQTGGFDIKDTNNLKSGLSRIDEDLRFHYIVSYVPKNADYDGRFRQISVKLDKPGLEVQTRKGYYALPGTGDSPILDYEGPALVALANSKAKDNPALQAAAFSFPGAQNPGLVPILVEVPAKEFTFEVDKEKNTYKSDFSIVAVVKDQSGKAVTKVSQHYEVSGPIDKLDPAKAADILFYREARLPAGKYSVEAVTYDATSGNSYVKSAAVEVPLATPSTLKMSSVAVLQRVERMSDADKKIDNPFHYKEVLIYPNLGQALSKSAGKQVAFFCAVYPSKDAASPPKLNIRVQSGSNIVFDKPAALGPADSSGRIQFAGALPLEAFPPGTYVLEITAADDHMSVSRSTQFSVQP